MLGKYARVNVSDPCAYLKDILVFRINFVQEFWFIVVAISLRWTLICSLVFTVIELAAEANPPAGLTTVFFFN